MHLIGAPRGLAGGPSRLRRPTGPRWLPVPHFRQARDHTCRLRRGFLGSSHGPARMKPTAAGLRSSECRRRGRSTCRWVTGSRSVGRRLCAGVGCWVVRRDRTDAQGSTTNCHKRNDRPTRPASLPAGAGRLKRVQRGVRPEEILLWPKRPRWEWKSIDPIFKRGSSLSMCLRELSRRRGKCLGRIRAWSNP